jgi:hypothetical protein
MNKDTLAAKFDKALAEDGLCTLSVPVVFPSAAEVRAIKTKAMRRLDELKDGTKEFMSKTLRKQILDAQENGFDCLAYKETVYFKYPEFVKNDRGMFVEILKANLEPLGYSVFAATDATDVIVKWSVPDKPKPRGIVPC